MNIDLIVQEGVDPLFSAATDRHLMRAVSRHPREGGGVLRVFECQGDILSLGRYNLAPLPVAGVAPGFCRRHSGGRLLPFGDGFVGLSLILPHRSALFSSDPSHLSPHQVINRHVRGILEACTAFGVAAFYPGRDLVTVGRQVVAAVSFETDEQGTLLFEAVIANRRDFGLLGEFLARIRIEEGVDKARVFPEQSTTSLACQLGTRLLLAEVAAELSRGFARQFGVTLNQRSLRPLEIQAITAIADRYFEAGQWLYHRKRFSTLDRCASVKTQLGNFEVHLSLQNQQIIKQVGFAGDFIANSPAMVELERELRLCPAKWSTVEAVVRGVFSKPENFILGVGRLRTVVDTILRAAAPATNATRGS